MPNTTKKVKRESKQLSTVRKNFEAYKTTDTIQENLLSEFVADNTDITAEKKSDNETKSLFSHSICPYDRPTCNNQNSLYTDSLKIYIEEISQYPLLSPEETMCLSKKISLGYLSAREQFIKSNLRFAFFIALKYVETGLPLLDLIQQANLGLIKAVELYDPSKGTRFSTYSVHLMRYSILQYVNEQSQLIRIPERVLADIAKIKDITAKYYLEFMRYPTDNEVAEQTGFTLKHIKRIKRLIFSHVSTEEKINKEMDNTLLDLLAADEHPFDEVHLKECRKQIMGLLSKLDERERRILFLRYGFDGEGEKSLKEVGKILGLTRERIRQIEARALKKIRNMPDIVTLYDFIR